MRPEAKRGTRGASRHDGTDGTETAVEDSGKLKTEMLSQATEAAGQQRASGKRSEPLSVCVERAVEAYFEDLDGERTADLYQMVLAEVEAPLLRSVMRNTDDNQSRAAEILGLSRGTLRKKLKQYGLL